MRAVRAHHKRHTPHKHKKSQPRQRHSAGATPPPPTAATVPAPFLHHRRSNQAPCFEDRQPLLHPPARPRSQNPPHHRNHQPHHSTHQPRPAALGWAPATPPASPGHPPTRKTDFLLALTFSARHAALLVVLAVQLALVVVVGAAHATAPVVGLWWVPGLVSRLDGQHKALGEAHLLCRGRQARAGEPPRGSVSRPARSTRS